MDDTPTDGVRRRVSSEHERSVAASVGSDLLEPEARPDERKGVALDREQASAVGRRVAGHKDRAVAQRSYAGCHA
jgi:hypothetical protein